MKNRNYIKYFVIIGVILFVIINYLSNILLKLDKSLLDLINYANTFTIIIWVLYIKCLWKYNPFEKIPKIYGNYELEFISTFDNQKRIMNITIKQDLFSTRIYMKTKESISKSIVSSFVSSDDYTELIYCYENTPNSKERKHSEIHNGTCKLIIYKKNIIGGSYYTDKGYSGDFKKITRT